MEVPSYAARKVPLGATQRQEAGTPLREYGTWRLRRQRLVKLHHRGGVDGSAADEQWTLSGHKGWVLCVEWDAREKMLATGGHDGQVRLWSPQTGQPAGQPLLGHSKWITSLAFEPLHLSRGPSQRIASASKDGTVRVWNTSTRKLDFVLTGHAASVNVVRWGGEGVIYTGSSDRTVKVWSGQDVSLYEVIALAKWLMDRAS